MTDRIFSVLFLCTGNRLRDIGQMDGATRAPQKA
jgi:hypothetical protein